MCGDRDDRRGRRDRDALAGQEDDGVKFVVAPLGYQIPGSSPPFPRRVFASASAPSTPKPKWRGPDAVTP